MKKRLAFLLAIPALFIGLFAGSAWATSLSSLGAPPVNNVNCWAQDGFGFVDVSCQYGTPYNYAQALYASWISRGQIILYYDNWPTAAGQPNGTTAYHENWSTDGFNTIETTTNAAYSFTLAYYGSWVNSGVIVVCTPGYTFCT